MIQLVRELKQGILHGYEADIILFSVLPLKLFGRACLCSLSELVCLRMII